MDPRNISIEDYTYELPDNRIAYFPKQERDSSKLLVYRNGAITEDIFSNVIAHLPAHSTIIFNNTRVVEARLQFRKPTGANIEIFCLEPADIYPDVATALATTENVLWKCMVGNASSWNKELILEKVISDKHLLKAEMVSRNSDHFVIKLAWQPQELSFAEILHEAGSIPLPPYIKRKAENTDIERYQTVYANYSGSVAAPTAGLHFTGKILDRLSEKNIEKEFVTLHVGAGTFKPVKSEIMNDHEMHAEFIEIKRSLLEKLNSTTNGKTISVGTTSLRTLESIYWLGHKIFFNRNITPEELYIDQWYPYAKHADISLNESLDSLIKWMDEHAVNTLITKTSLLIAPGYKFRIVSVLITNFHQPRSTLLLLVAAFIGEKWKEVYNYALSNNFRFLSYGDACLFFRP